MKLLTNTVVKALTFCKGNIQYIDNKMNHGLLSIRNIITIMVILLLFITGIMAYNVNIGLEELDINIDKTLNIVQEIIEPDTQNKTFLDLLHNVIIIENNFHTTQDKIIYHFLIFLFLSGTLTIITILILSRIENKLNKERKTALELSERDYLTNIYNRQGFHKQLKYTLKNNRCSKNEKNILLYIDLDNFKNVNDTSGHEAGDKLLKNICNIFQANIRRDDIIGRMGGDEFAIIIKSCKMRDAKKIANNIRQDICEYKYICEKNLFNIGASIGLVQILNELTIEDLIKRADKACYEAKKSGKNKVITLDYNDKEIIQSNILHDIEENILHAFNNNGLILYFQDILSTGKFRKKCEILIRLKVNNEIITPGCFLPILEKYNLMLKLEKYIIKQLFSKLSRINIVNYYDMINVNLSQEFVCNQEMCDYIIMQAAKYKIDPRNICFEINENVAISNIYKVKKLMLLLKKQGFTFALDDFGVGVSCLNYLKELPFDVLKIDGCFIKNIENDKTNRSIVGAIKQIADAVDLEVVAECVETSEAFKTISDLKIQYAQGFLFHKPEPFDNFIKRKLQHKYKHKNNIY